MDDGKPPKRKRGPYRKYTIDAAACVPKSTLNRIRKEQSTADALSLEDNIVNEGCSVFFDGPTIAENIVAEDLLDQDNGTSTSITFVDDEESDVDLEEADHSDIEESDNLDKQKRKQDNVFDDAFQPIYPGSRLTIAVSMLLIMTAALRHGFSASALADVLCLLELHCLIPNTCKTTLQSFRKFFSDMKNPVVLQYYCSFCSSFYGPVKVDSCKTCHKNEIGYFLQIPLLQQLQSILTGPVIQTLLDYHSSRAKLQNKNIEDIYDGQEHFDGRHYRGSNPLLHDEEIHLSLQINTDGVSLFRSSCFSVWPIYGVLNELPYKMRTSRENRIFIGLWFGKSKPDMKVFLYPFVDEMKTLFNKGFPVQANYTMLTARAILLGVVCDAPARCMVQSFTQFNGKYGCPCCMASGESVIAERGRVHAYPYDLSNEHKNTGHADARKHDETRVFASDAVNAGKPQFGVKGYSPLLNLPKFDIIRSVTIDYMHCILLGVVKKFLHLWTDSKHNDCPWYIGTNFVQVLNDRLTSIKPPNIVTRLPGSIYDLCNWKASQFRPFLLFYSAPCLYGILPDEYHMHFMLLVQATYLLLQSSISPGDIKMAKRLLRRFCFSIRFLYGIRHESFNVHCLLHLHTKVKDLGPLWCHSCFYYEDLNRDFRNLFHGTQQVQMQIMHAVCIQRSLPYLVSCLPVSSLEESFYHQMTHKSKSMRNRMYIGQKLYAVGLLFLYTPPNDVSNTLSFNFGMIVTTEKFYRLYMSGLMVHSQEYLAVTRRNRYTVKFNYNGNVSFGFVQYYLRVSLEDGNVYVAVVDLLPIADPIFASDELVSLNHIIPVSVDKKKTVVVTVDQIIEMCAFVTGDFSEVIVLFPNKFERD